MPGVDGHAFLERFRTSPANRVIPVVLWTAKDLGRLEEAKLAREVVAIKLKGRDGPMEVAHTVKRFVPVEAHSRAHEAG